MVIEFYCIFDNISDYLEAHLYSLFNVENTICEHFIIQGALKYKDELLSPKRGSIFFCFLLWVGESLKIETTLESINSSIEEIKEYHLFKNEAKNNFICLSETLNTQINEEGVFFDDFIELVKYCHSHMLIDMNNLTEKVKKEVEDIIVL